MGDFILTEFVEPPTHVYTHDIMPFFMLLFEVYVASLCFEEPLLITLAAKLDATPSVRAIVTLK